MGNLIPTCRVLFRCFLWLVKSYADQTQQYHLLGSPCSMSIAPGLFAGVTQLRSTDHGNLCKDFPAQLQSSVIQ